MGEALMVPGAFVMDILLVSHVRVDFVLMEAVLMNMGAVFVRAVILVGIVRFGSVRISEPQQSMGNVGVLQISQAQIVESGYV